jgi:DNA polymerase-3 subunit delta'
MSWSDIVGHAEMLNRFRRSAEAGRLASTYLFVGPKGIGKRTFALQVARCLFCQRHAEHELEACGECAACQQVVAGTHPDLDLLSRPPDKSFIPLELLIGDEAHRAREGLCHRLGLKPYYGGRKIAVLDDADYLNAEGANCLLKTLEEPPPRSMVILIGTSEQRQLPTIRSRSQIIRFQPLSREQVEELLLRRGLVDSHDEARTLSALSEGSVERAMKYAEPAVREFRQRWLESLATGREQLFGFAKDLSSFVDAAGKEAPPRRDRLKHVAEMAAGYFEAVLHAMHGGRPAADPQLAELAATSAGKPVLDAESVVQDLARCLEMEAQVEANANQAALIECWLDDLATNHRRGPV